MFNIESQATWVFRSRYYSFCRLYTHKKWNYAQNSENLKLKYKLQDSRLLNSKHNSHNLAHVVHLENNDLQNTKPIYQLVSLTSHLVKLNWQNT